MKVALDTNVLVSAAIADGPPRRLLERAAEGRIELLIPDLVLRELGRILGEKLGLGPDVFERFLALIDELSAHVVATPENAEARSGDPADDRILAAAMAAGAEVLASGDRRHLLPLGEVDGMRLLSPQQLLAELAV